MKYALAIALCLCLSTTHGFENLNDALSFYQKMERKGESPIQPLTTKEEILHFQKRHGLEADGVVGKATLEALNVPVVERIQQIQTNIERENNSPTLSENDYIVVNIPAYQVAVFQNGQRVLFIRAIVGMPTWPTPVFNSQITALVFNPRWHIPANIVSKETFKKIKKNPDYLMEQEIKIYKITDGKKEEVDPKSLDWSKPDPIASQYLLQQDIGPLNPLGHIKFFIPNKMDIYLHDSPSKNLFHPDMRAFSHGCVRVEKAFDLAEYLLTKDPKWNRKRIQEMVDHAEEKTIRLPQPMPIHFIYQTAWVDEEGNLNFRPDIYKLDNPI